jgi:Spy/CpxP family protein refolding chaperone
MKKLGRYNKLAIASLSAIALAASIAAAQTVKTDQDHGRGGMRGGLFSKLNLTDDQKAKIKQIHESFAERSKPLREQLRAKRQELRQASEGGTFNEALATQKLTEMAGLQAKMMGEEFRLHQETLSVLTAEQKARLDQAKAQFKAREGERPRRGERRDNQ